MSLEETDQGHSNFAENKHIYVISSLDSSWYFLRPCWESQPLAAHEKTCPLQVEKGLKTHGSSPSSFNSWKVIRLNPELAGQPTWFSKHSVSCCSVAKSCPTLCDPMDCSPPGSSVHGILQARTLEWVPNAFSWGSSWSGDWTRISCIGMQSLYHWATREVHGVNFLTMWSRTPLYFCCWEFNFETGITMSEFTQEGLTISLAWLELQSCGVQYRGIVKRPEKGYQ